MLCTLSLSLSLCTPKYPLPVHTRMQVDLTAAQAALTAAQAELAALRRGQPLPPLSPPVAAAACDSSAVDDLFSARPALHALPSPLSATDTAGVRPASPFFSPSLSARRAPDGGAGRGPVSPSAASPSWLRGLFGGCFSLPAAAYAPASPESYGGSSCITGITPHVHSPLCNHAPAPAGLVLLAARSGDVPALQAALKARGSTEEADAVRRMGVLHVSFSYFPHPVSLSLCDLCTYCCYRMTTSLRPGPHATATLRPSARSCRQAPTQPPHQRYGQQFARPVALSKE